MITISSAALDYNFTCDKGLFDEYSLLAAFKKRATDLGIRIQDFEKLKFTLCDKNEQPINISEVPAGFCGAIKFSAEVEARFLAASKPQKSQPITPAAPFSADANKLVIQRHGYPPLILALNAADLKCTFENLSGIKEELKLEEFTSLYRVDAEGVVALIPKTAKVQELVGSNCCIVTVALAAELAAAELAAAELAVAKPVAAERAASRLAAAERAAAELPVEQLEAAKLDVKERAVARLAAVRRGAYELEAAQLAEQTRPVVARRAAAPNSFNWKKALIYTGCAVLALAGIAAVVLSAGVAAPAVIAASVVAKTLAAHAVAGLVSGSVATTVGAGGIAAQAGLFSRMATCFRRKKPDASEPATHSTRNPYRYSGSS